VDIKPEHFDHGGEVDCGAWHKDPADAETLPPLVKGGYRVSIRRVHVGAETREHGEYEVYRFYHWSGEELVEIKGTLEECVRHVNGEYNQDDTIGGVKP